MSATTPTNWRLENEKLKNEINALKHENQTLKDEIGILQYEAEGDEEIPCKIQQLQCENDKLKQQIDILHYDFIVLKEKNQTMNFEIEQHKMRIKKNEFYIDNVCISENEKLNKEIEELKERKDYYQCQCRQLLTEKLEKEIEELNLKERKNYYEKEYRNLFAEIQNIFVNWEEMDYGEALDAVTNLVNKNKIEMNKDSLHAMLIGKLGWWTEKIIKDVSMSTSILQCGAIKKLFRQIKKQRNYIIHNSQHGQWQEPEQIKIMIRMMSTMVHQLMEHQ